MKPILSLFALLCFLSSFVQVLAQSAFKEGYYLSNEGILTYGLIRHEKKGQDLSTALFKHTDGSESEILRAGDIKAYGIGDAVLYFSQEIELNGEQKTVFLEVVVLGKVSLYQYKNRFFAEHKRKLVELKPQEKEESTAFLAEAFAACPDMAGKLGTGQMNVNVNQLALVELYEAYYSCADEIFFKYKKPPWRKLELGVWGGVEVAQVRFKGVRSNYTYLEDASFQDIRSPVFGLSIDLSSPRLSEQLSVVIEPSVQYYFIQAYNEVLKDDRVTRSDITFKFNELAVPIGVKYYPVSKWRRLFLGAGIAPQFHFDSDNHIFQEVEQLTEKTVKASKIAFDFAKYFQSGVWVNLGTNILNRPAFSIPIQFRYLRSSSLIDAYPQSVSSGAFSSNHVSSLMITCGLNF